MLLEFLIKSQNSIYLSSSIILQTQKKKYSKKINQNIYQHSQNILIFRDSLSRHCQETLGCIKKKTKTI